jgi:hypothetical protein
MSAAQWRLIIWFLLATSPHSVGLCGSEFIDSVRAAWKKREAHFRSFTVAWDQKKSVPKGSDGRNRKNQPLPSSDVTLMRRFQMRGDNKRLRLDREGQRFDADSLSYIDEAFVTTFDGHECRQEFLPDSVHKRGGGVISTGEFDDGTYLDTQPIILFFRPLHISLGSVDLGNYHDIGRFGHVHGVQCRMLERDFPDNPLMIDRLWIADERDYLILRRERGHRDLPGEEVTIAYEPHQDWGWKVTGWNYVQRTQRNNPTITVNTITYCDVDLPLDGSIFQHKFTAGASIYYPQAPEKHAIAREDGSLRPLTNGEMTSGKSVEDLMNSTPPPEAYHDNSSLWNWQSFGVLAVLAVIIVTWHLKYRRAYEPP